MIPDLTQLSLGALAMLVAILAIQLARLAIVQRRRKHSDPPSSDLPPEQ